MTEANNSSGVIRIAMAGSAFTMVYQVAGKAARDALFLSYFRPEALPAMVVAAAVLSLVLGISAGRLLARIPPGRTVPWLTLVSAALQVGEWTIFRDAPKAGAALVYLHVVGLAAIVNSGFWSVMNEQLDPRTAKRYFGRITSAGTIGGVAGGILAERIGSLVSPAAVLLCMAGAHVVLAMVLFSLPPAPVHASGPALKVRDVLRRSSYVRNLALLVIAGTFAAALLDYVLKVEARQALGPGEPLLRFFAAFHTGTAVLSFLMQVLATPWFMQHLGVGRTVASLPVSVAASGTLAVVTGGFPAVVLARAVEAVVRGSVFRAGYELLYAPMLPAEKRAVKSVNDVAADRLGDALGGAFTHGAIALAASFVRPALLSTAAVVSAGAWLLARRLHHGYLRSLEKSLGARARAVDLGGRTQERRSRMRPARNSPPPLPPPEFGSSILPATASRARELLSREPERVVRALDPKRPLERELVPWVIEMIGWAPVSENAARALTAVGRRYAGQLGDYLLDGNIDVTVRCRIPRILARIADRRSVDALLRGLADEHFEVRFQCARALDDLHRNTAQPIDPDRVFAVIQDELRALSLGAEGVARPGSAELEYIFALLASVLPREPVWIAHQALHVEDPQLQGLALEYLESALPPDIREPLLELVEPGAPRPALPRAGQILAQELLRVRQQIAARLDS